MRKLITRLDNYQALAIDERLLDAPTEEFRNFLLEVFERRYGTCSTILCAQFKQSDWHPRLDGGVHAAAIMDRIVHNIVVDMGEMNMREHFAAKEKAR